MSSAVETDQKSGSMEYDSALQHQLTEELDKVPVPTGYRMLIALPSVKEKTSGGIFLPDERRNAESVASILGFVVEQGPDCYKDQVKFPTGPWCNKGDWVLMRSYSGTRFSIEGVEYRLINDDSVEGTVSDPTGISRV